jgi:hypothetical protein
MINQSTINNKHKNYKTFLAFLFLREEEKEKECQVEKKIYGKRNVEN